MIDLDQRIGELVEDLAHNIAGALRAEIRRLRAELLETLTPTGPKAPTEITAEFLNEVQEKIVEVVESNTAAPKPAGDDAPRNLDGEDLEWVSRARAEARRRREAQ